MTTPGAARRARGLNYSVRRGGSTPLLFAARSGDAESARLLLRAGADANDAQADGLPALTLAAYSGHGDVAVALAHALLARGAKADAPMTKGTPMRRTSHDYDLPAALIPSTPLQLAARFLEPDIVRELKAAGADTRATMRDGTTTVMLAAGVGAAGNQDRRGVALIDGGGTHARRGPLVMAGAEVNVKNLRGQSPLGLIAKRDDRKATADLLRMFGAVEAGYALWAEAGRKSV